MVKTSQQKKASFSVTEPKKVLQFCQDKLKPLLDKRELDFKLLEPNSEHRIFALITKDLRSSSIATDDRHNRHNVVPLLATKYNTYWINISLTFLPIFGKSQQKTNPQSFQFSGISIRVFKGLMTDNNKQPLFRAEWDALTEENNHAQPHWHIYKSFQARNANTSPSSDFEYLIQSNEIQDFGELAERLNFGEKENNALDNQEEFDIENGEESLYEDDWDSSTKFHFAMSSQWHEGKTHKITLDEEKLLYSWLVECVKYIKYQLKYVDR